MEVELKKYMIKYENGNKVLVSAKNLEEALEEFKALRIETATKEIRVLSNYEVYHKHKKESNDG
jgi:hypothetical protein